MKSYTEKLIFDKYYYFLFFFYVFSHGLVIMIPNAVYWDDWVLYGVASDEIFETFHQAGSMFNMTSYVHIFLLALGPWSYKFLTFVFMFGAAIALDAILKGCKFLSRDFRVVIVLVFMILPLYWARVAMIDFIYTFSYFLFFMGWALMDKKRVLALIFFFISFNANSLLVFYMFPIVYSFYKSYNGGNLVRYTARFFVGKLDFLILPFLYYYIKTFYYAPSGLYAGYNQGFIFELDYLLSMGTIQYNEFIHCFYVFFLDSWNVFFVLTGMAIFCYLIFKYRLFGESTSLLLSLAAFLLGSFVFLASVFPYWAVGHVPTFSEWTSRHQLLMPLGVSILFFSIFVLLNYYMRVVVLSFVLSVSMVFNIRTYKDFYFDWQKQLQLVQLFGVNEDVMNSQIIVIEDKTLSDNAIGRLYRSYEWNGLLATSFGDEKRFGLEIRDYNSFISGVFFRGYFEQGAKYRAGEFDVAAPNQVVNIEIYSLPARTIKDKALYYIGYKKYEIVSTVEETIRLDAYN